MRSSRRRLRRCHKARSINRTFARIVWSRAIAKPLPLGRRKRRHTRPNEVLDSRAIEADQHNRQNAQAESRQASWQFRVPWKCALTGIRCAGSATIPPEEVQRRFAVWNRTTER